MSHNMVVESKWAVRWCEWCCDWQVVRGFCRRHTQCSRLWDDVNGVVIDRRSEDSADATHNAVGCEMMWMLWLTGGQRTLQTPHTMQWAVRQQDTSAGPTSSVNSTTTRPATSAVAATTTGTTNTAQSRLLWYNTIHCVYVWPKADKYPA